MRNNRDPNEDRRTFEAVARVDQLTQAPQAPSAVGDLLSKLRRARRSLDDHFELASNAGAVALGTLANGGLGFVYWWVSARFFTPSAVGLASAEISLIGLLSLGAELGLGTLLQGEIPRRRRLAPHLVSAALLVALASSFALGLVYLVVTAVLARNMGGASIFMGTRLLVVISVAVQTASVVLDSALVGMLSGSLRLLRNLLFAGLKLLFVIGAVALLIPGDWQLNTIIGSWVVAQAAACFGIAAIARLRGARIWYRPRFEPLRRLFGVSLWHYALNVVAAAPSLVLPVIIASVLSPEQNAPFYAAWMLLSLAGVAPVALANVLFTIGSGSSSNRLSSLRFSFSVSLAIGAVTAVGFWLFSNVALGVLNPVYFDLVGSSLRFLGASVPLMAVKVHYMTLQRLDRQLPRAAFTLGVLGVLEIVSAGVGAEWAGLFGATTGWLLAMGLEAAVLWPTIWRHLSGKGAGTGNGPTVQEKAVALPLLAERGTYSLSTAKGRAALRGVASQILSFDVVAGAFRLPVRLIPRPPTQTGKKAW
jgi:O-antigen/teichoic acid export membrane protein